MNDFYLVGLLAIWLAFFVLGLQIAGLRARIAELERRVQERKK